MTCFTSLDQDFLRLAEQGVQWLAVEPWGMVGVHEHRGLAFMHCRIYAWGPVEARACRKHWRQVLETLRGKGYHEIFVCQKKADNRLGKFVRMFGFRDCVGSTATHHLMRQEI